MASSQLATRTVSHFGLEAGLSCVAIQADIQGMLPRGTFYLRSKTHLMYFVSPFHPLIRRQIRSTSAHNCPYPVCSSPADGPVPDFYVQAADASITALTVGRVPPKDGQNRFIYNADPLYLACTSFDLTTRVMDLREPHLPVEIGRTRCEWYSFRVQLHQAGRIITCGARDPRAMT